MDRISFGGLHLGADHDPCALLIRASQPIEIINFTLSICGDSSARERGPHLRAVSLFVDDTSTVHSEKNCVHAASVVPTRAPFGCSTSQLRQVREGSRN